MNPMVALAAGNAVLGLMQAEEAKKKEARDVAMAAEIAKWSPWTKMQPNQIDRAGSPFQYAAQGALAGAATGQSIQQANAYEKYLEANTPENTSAEPAAAPAPGASLTAPTAAPVFTPVPIAPPQPALNYANPQVDPFSTPLPAQRIPYSAWTNMQNPSQMQRGY